MREYWPILSRMESGQCEATTDFLIGIPPGGCSPAVVRSDLLEEQNVPVFCKLDALRINPLIKVSSIKSISFKGDKPEGIAGISFHPARAAVRSYKTLLGDPMLNNIGYVVIVLKQNRVEEDMEEWIAGNLTATIRYDSEGAYGVGASDYYLPAMSRSEWEQNFEASSFWNGRGYVRVKGVGQGVAQIELLTDKDNVFRTFNLKEGETSNLIYFPGYYCKAGLKVKLNKVVAPENMVKLDVDGNEIWVRKGSKILNNQCTVQDLTIGNKTNNVTVKLSCPGQKFTLSLQEKDNKTGLTEASDSRIDNYFKKANDTVNELIEEYRAEEKENGEPYGEEALFEQILMAQKNGKYKTQEALMTLFIDSYPTSSAISKVKQDLMRLGKWNYSNAYHTALVNNKYYFISLEDFKKVDEGKKKATIKIGSATQNVVEDQRINFSSDEYLIIDEILPGKVDIDYYNNKKDAKKKKESAIIPEGDSASLGGRSINVRSVDVTEIAYVSLIPEVKNDRTEANFTYRIGIEKRGIQLSPAKTREMIKNLNKTIEDWENIIENLGSVIKGWKGACFATSAVLMMKNMFNGFDGESLARQKVMKRYKEICDRDHAGVSRTKCYNDLASDIDRDVSAMKDGLNVVNGQMDPKIEAHSTEAGVFEKGGIKNDEAYLTDLRGLLGSDKITVVKNNETFEVDPSSLTTTSQIRSVLLSRQLAGNGVAGEVSQAEMYGALNSAVLQQQAAETKAAAAAKISGAVGSGKNPVVQTVLSKNVKTLSWGGETYGSYGSLNGVEGWGAKDKIQYLNLDGRNYVLKMGQSLTGNMAVNESYRLDGDQWVKASDAEIRKMRGYVFTKAGGEAGECSYVYRKPTVKYYKSGNNENLPAIIPFDLKKGWYVMVPNSAGTFIDNSPQGYTAAGDVKYFKICNVGPNGLMENGQYPDDVCQSFDANSAGSVDRFIPCPSLKPEKVKELYSKAREAIRQASSQAGQRIINILGQSIDLGPPMSDTGDFECQDFMSPEDCQWMFNTCDPVICPTSRCDLGGKMPVSDVVQTGIIGSIALCLPNAQEGIFVPVCLTGIHAGLDSYVSILKSERDCLELSLETGEHVGICDEITSIYLCEFFWRQLSPVMDLLIPRFVEGLYGGFQGTRGGGEYLTVQHSWDNLQKGIDFFQNDYAQNAFKAFRVRNVQEAGGEVCRAFVGTTIPTSAEGLNNLLEPESPTQFYAHFSERTFSEATVPATSHYKLYYHIYAGNDKGVQYQIYLKNPPQSTYYRTNPSVHVKNGFIPRGEEADESIDFTAPSGYKELCVVVDAKEECGFKQVTTDFGLDYIQKKYVEEQASETNINTEKECISGTKSAIPLINPNIQAGAEEAIQPEIALRGIVRICASANPEAGVTSTNANSSRWKAVGTCGTPDLTCWLDINSVENDLKSIEAIDNSTLSILDESRGLLNNTRQSYQDVQKELAFLRENIPKLVDGDLASDETPRVVGYIRRLNTIIGVGDIFPQGTNANRAEALSWRAAIYRMIVEFNGRGKVNSKEVVAAAKKGVGVTDIPVDLAGELTAGEGEEESTTVEGNAAEEVNGAEKKKGFSFYGPGIFFEGIPTGMYVEEKTGDRHYVIFEIDSDQEIGKIIEGRISFGKIKNAKSEKVIVHASNLKKYGLNEDLEFYRLGVLEGIVNTLKGYSDEESDTSEEGGESSKVVTLDVILYNDNDDVDKLNDGEYDKITVTGRILGDLGDSMNRGEIVIEGNVEGYVGNFMGGGRITVEGTAEGPVGTLLDGGEIIIEEDAEGPVGTSMTLGDITIGGDARSSVGDSMSGGDIVIEGEVNYPIGEDSSGGEIRIRQSQLYLEDKIGDNVGAQIYYWDEEWFPFL
ncbi:hypothetical protein HN499_03510 [archaeon]|nr:hypothetical protein [archaeon]MBT6955942.1 hypothetical protein [archaeon]